MAATKEMTLTIKLMIDPESNRLIFAEASKDFVDFLIYILSLPIGTVTKLLRTESMVGSIGNIYKSVANLDNTYLGPNLDKDFILNPTGFSSPVNIPLSSSNKSYINIFRKFYTCWDLDCKSGITNIDEHVYCPGCNGRMNREIEFIDKDSQGYVHNVASYMISDDLSITPISTMSIVSMLNKFNVTKLEERVVEFGNEEALELLNASLQSTTVLTDVFLLRKFKKPPGNEKTKMNIWVHSQSGNKMRFLVQPSTSIYKVMATIEEIESIPSKHLDLLFDGHRLHGHLTFADYNFVDGSVIDLMLHLRGC